MASDTVNVRYMVDDVEAAIAWYTQHLGFELLSNHAPAFADVSRGGLRLLLAVPPRGSQPLAEGSVAFLPPSMP